MTGVPRMSPERPIIWSQGRLAPGSRRRPVNVPIHQIEEMNGKLKRYCECKGCRFVENSKIDGGFLNRSKLHLHKKGTALLSWNIANVLKYI